MPARETKEIPLRALQFAADVEFGKPATDGTVPVSVVARSAEAVFHWFWGNVVHDLAGMQPSKPRIPFDYCHNDSQVMGYADKFETVGQLVASGVLIPYPQKPDDITTEVLYKSRMGQPYEGSIFFAEEPVVIEDVPPGMSTQANGKTFVGPVTIIRQWTLRGVAICPYGTDPNTSLTSFKDDRKARVTFTRKEIAMDPAGSAVTPAPTPAVAPATPPIVPTADGKPPETKPGEKPAEAVVPPVVETVPPVVPPVASTTLGGRTGKDFLTAFGDQGGVWFAEGLSFEQAQGKFNAKQSERLAALETENKTLKTQLSAARGEKNPLSFSSTETEPDGNPKPAAKANAAGLPAGLSKFAASLPVSGNAKK